MFKKVYNVKIITIAMGMLFLFNNLLYALRVPMDVKYKRPNTQMDLFEEKKTEPDKTTYPTPGTLFDILGQAVRYRRKGHEVFFVIGHHVEEIGNSKVPRKSIFVIFKDNNNWYATDTDEFISKKGSKVQNGLYRINDIKKYSDELNLKFSAEVAVDNTVTSVLSCVKSYWKSLENQIRLKYAEKFKSFIKNYAVKVKVDNKAMNLNNRKNNFTKSILLLPEKFIFSLRELRFKEKIESPHKRVVAIDTGGKLIYEDFKSASGEAGNQIIALSSASLFTAIHEFMHVWTQVVPEEIIKIFYDISWTESDIRNVDLDDFVNLDAMTNLKEDFADTGEEYVTNANKFRKKARKSMNEGKFALAAKYLFIKCVVMKDWDYKFFEYHVDDSLAPMTIDEVEQAIENSKAEVPEYILKSIRKIKELADSNKVHGYALDKWQRLKGPGAINSSI